MNAPLLRQRVRVGLAEFADLHDQRRIGAFVRAHPQGSPFHLPAWLMPYWGAETREARALRANDRIYFELMRYARERGCERFDFGRSKTGNGPSRFKRNWGFKPEPLTYAAWTAPDARARDADPRGAANSRLAALWRQLPAAVADRFGPPIARGLG